jgi:hypothetical protein
LKPPVADFVGCGVDIRHLFLECHVELNAKRRRLQSRYQQPSILALTLTFALLTDRAIAETIGREFPAFAGLDHKTIENWLGEEAKTLDNSPPDSRQHFDVWRRTFSRIYGGFRRFPPSFWIGAAHCRIVSCEAHLRIGR